MHAPVADEWLLRFARALAGDDASACIEAALTVLAEIGVAPHAGAAGYSPWLTLAIGDETWLFDSREALDAEATELLGNMLRAAFARRAEQQERTRMRERMEMLSAASFEGLLIHVDGVVIDANQRVAEMVGYELPEMLGPGTFARCVAEEDKAFLRERIAAREEGAYVITAVRKDGSRFRAELQSKQGRLGERPVRVAAVRDVTERERMRAERRRLEVQVERAQRLESLGVLAGGIAHDFNNLLVGVLGGAEVLLAHLSDPRDVEAASMIRMAGLRAADLTRQMLAYAGKNAFAQHETLDLAALCHELRSLLEATLSKKARVTIVAGPDCIVDAERATLTQVVMNLLVNASDALDEKPGVIEVKTQRVSEPDARWSEALGATITPGDWVLLEVRDTGHGMDEATRARIFEPFFTTKPRGHGLGLAACLGIIRSHGGAIRVESQPGKGACFGVLLPTSVRSRGAARDEPRDVGSRPCKVLVIDDEDLVRAHLRRVLEERGFAVEEASDGRSALAIYERVAPDVIVIDFSMPDLDGTEVVEAMRRAGCTVPVILSSGYLELAAERALPAGAIQATLQKPYGISQLLAAIRRVQA